MLSCWSSYYLGGEHTTDTQDNKNQIYKEPVNGLALGSYDKHNYKATKSCYQHLLGLVNRLYNINRYLRCFIGFSNYL